jgi:DNA-binding protein HU-beta
VLNTFGPLTPLIDVGTSVERSLSHGRWEGTVTKAELVQAVAMQTRLTKKSAADILDVIFSNIGSAVKRDERFSYPGFGTWSLRTRKARKIRNPQTNELMKLKATKTIGFRPAKELKQTL